MQRQYQRGEDPDLEQVMDQEADKLLSGAPVTGCVARLCQAGMDEGEAREFLSAVRRHHRKIQAAASRKSGGGGIAGFFGLVFVLLLINLLSYLFDWPFWIY